MKKHKTPRFTPLFMHLACAGLLTLTASPSAQADEIQDLKVLVKQLEERIQQIEARSAAREESQPAPTANNSQPTATAVNTPTAASAPTAPTGLQWKFYGRADIGYTESTAKNANGAIITNRRFNQGQMASRLGLSGAWVFNPDYKAIFGAETGLNLFNGNAGGGTQNNTTSPVLFNRGATAGIATSRFGSIEGGTMYMAPFWVGLGADQASAHNYGANDFSALFSVIRPESLSRYLKDPANSNGSSSLTGGNSGTALFYANSVRYRTPVFKGLSGELSYSMGQQASAATPLKNDGRTWAGNVLYNAGPFFAGYAHMNYLQDADIATKGAPIWQTRNQVTDVLGTRYSWNGFTIGGAYTLYRVSNTSGYRARAFGLSGAYDLGKNRFELSYGHIDYDNTNAAGAYGLNTGDQKGDPNSSSIGFGYLYNLEANLTLYAYYNKVFNNSHANLGVLQFRGDNSNKFYGYSPREWTTGLFYVF